MFTADFFHAEAPLTGFLWLGVDVGTQSAKVSIVDDEGTVHAQSSAPLISAREGNRHEQNPADWIGQSRVAMTGAIAMLPSAILPRISGMAVCATSGTITVVDGAGKPASTGLMYNDARAGALSSEVAGADPERWKRLGYRIQPTWALPKILWLTRKGLVGRGFRIANQADVVVSAITGGRVSSDWSHSLKSGYDLLELDWPLMVLDRLGIDRAKLPDVVAPGSVVGASSSEWARATGLPEGTPVFAGMTDGCAAQLGAGTLALGDLHSVIGTTLVVKGVSEHIVRDDSGAIYSHRAPHGRLWFPGGASNVGAGVLAEYFPEMDLAAATSRVSSAYDGKLTSIPPSYPLSGLGERFPVIRPDARGMVFTGSGSRRGGARATAPVNRPLADAARELDGDTLLASILLGIACVERLAVESMAAAGAPLTGTLSSSGGGTRNRWWTQLRSDLLGRTISVPISAEGSIGMAILAAWGAGQAAEHGTDGAAPESEGASLPEIARRMSPIGSVFDPIDAHHAQVNEQYALFHDRVSSLGWLGE